MALGGYLPPVVAEVVAEIGKYSAGMGAVKAEMGALEAAGTKLAAMGKVAAAGLAIGIAGVGFESVKMAASFDQQMEMIHTQAGASQAEVELLKQKVLALGPATGIGPEKLAEGLYHIESTGYRGQEALDILAASAHDAALGITDMDTMSNALAGTLSVGMKDIKNAADAANYLNITVGIGDMRMEKLAAAIGTGTLPAFKSAGLGMKDFSASLATLTDNAVPADEAATRLRMTVSLMAAPSGPAVKALNSIGLSSTALAEDLRKPDGLLLAVMDLKHHLEESGKSAVEQNAVIEHAFGGGKTSGAILTLLEETDRLKSKYEALGTAESRAKQSDEAWAQQQKQFSQQWKEFVATIEAAGIKIGNWLIPKLQDAASWIMKNGETVKVLAAIIGGVLLVAIGAWTVALVQAAIANVAATWEILLIIAAVAVLAAGIYELVKHWDTVWAWIKRIAGDVWGWLVGVWHTTVGALQTAWTTAWNWIKGIALDVWGWLVGAWHATINALEVAAHWVKTKIIDPIVRWFNENLLPPIKAVLAVISWQWKFLWGFLSVVIDDFKKIWGEVWGYVTWAAKNAWDNVLKPVLDFIVKYGIDPIADAVVWLATHWHVAWDAIVGAAKWAWDNVLKPTFAFIVKYGIDPVVAAAHWLASAWNTSWDGIKTAAKWAWDNVLKPTFDAIDKWGITPVRTAVDGLGKFWGTVWDGIKTAVSKVWDFLRPIFDKIGSAVAAVKKAISGIIAAPGQSGANVAHFLGFADGGVVPGPKGAPQLAVVHGGEQILSNDQLASMGGSRSLVAGGQAAGGAGAGGGGDIVLNARFVMPDGRQVRNEQLRYARRAAISPATLYPATTRRSF